MSEQDPFDRPVVALCGGIGGAKLALGLYHVVAPGRLTVVVNTGDDFEHLGLSISPDIDTVLYTLSGLADRSRGWGHAGETWAFMSALEALGGETWFQLGDRDLATHIERTRRLRSGETLSAVIEAFAQSMGIAARVLPMSDDRVWTVVETDEGALPFQDYFVRRQCRPRVKAVRYDGADTAAPLPAALDAMADPDLAVIILCPSNPYLSIDPMLAIPELRSALLAAPAPVIAVSPIVGGRAIKGPTAKLMAELGVEVSSVEIARYYGGLIDGFVLDAADAGLAAKIGCPTRVTDTVMETLADRKALARTCLAFADALSGLVMTPDPLWAIVPVKRFEAAKLRLAGILSSEHRSRLAEAMLRDVLAAAFGCPAIAGIAVVTSDEGAGRIAGEFGAEVVKTGCDPGLNLAVEAGLAHVHERAAKVLVLSADIPLVRAEDIFRLASLHGPAPAVTIAQAAADGGTNALVVSPPDIIGFQFGKSSESRHLEAARQAGAAVRSLTISRMAFDLDRPEDVARFLRAPSPTCTYRLLHRLAGELSLQPVPQGEFP